MPSVLVQVQFVVVDPNEAEDRYHWDPPSRELASEVLSRANQFSEARQGFDEAILSLEITQGKFLDELQETVRGHYPEARGYQLCFGNGPWNSRRPRLWNPRDWFNYVLLDVFDD